MRARFMMQWTNRVVAFDRVNNTEVLPISVSQCHLIRPHPKKAYFPV